ncbi:MAG: ABC transporter ATP-binding protein [Clostridiales bacterium]|nr:ABC transporter ATP-binding protein [Clostridiales bacterium]
MITVKNITKNFGDIKALDDVTLEITEGAVFGLIGTNGAGKSTLLRILSGVLKQDKGEVSLDGEGVYENPPVKSKFFFIPDDAYFFKNSTPNSAAAYYTDVYKDFDRKKFGELMSSFDLDPKRKISTFSKGMKKQVSIISAICSNTKYIYCDETFDGLDPVMRQAVKRLFADEMESRSLTPIIASHNLRELEDICENIGFLHKGGVLLSQNLTDLKLGICKIQLVPKPDTDVSAAFSGFKIYKQEARGNLHTLTLKSSIEEAEEVIKAIAPVYYEVLPLTLEEIFISEAETIGYSVKQLMLGEQKNK